MGLWDALYNYSVLKKAMTMSELNMKAGLVIILHDSFTLAIPTTCDPARYLSSVMHYEDSRIAFHTNFDETFCSRRLSKKGGVFDWPAARALTCPCIHGNLRSPLPKHLRAPAFIRIYGLRLP